MSISQLVVNPAYELEAAAFNPKDQPPYSILRNVLARIAAIVAPIFYAYQIGLHLMFAILRTVTYPIDRISPKDMFLSVLYSVQNLVSSILEIPHKLITGPSSVPNYCGNENRYQYRDIKPLYVDMKGSLDSLQPLKPI